MYSSNHKYISKLIYRYNVGIFLGKLPFLFTFRKSVQNLSQSSKSQAKSSQQNDLSSYNIHTNSHSAITLSALILALFLHVIIFLFSFSHINRPSGDSFSPIFLSLEKTVASTQTQTSERQELLASKQAISKHKKATKIAQKSPGNHSATHIPTINNPRFVKFKPPHYPKRAKMLGQQGIVKLKALINRQGKPISVDILSSSGYILLDNAAVDASKDWVLKPASKNGENIDSWAIIKYNFSLANSA